MTTLFEGFRDERIDIPTDAGTIAAWIGGEGPPLLLLHGYPQTRAMWHRLAPQLAAAGRTVIVPDLRGYGQSGSPVPRPTAGPTPSARWLATSRADVGLGFARFDVVGHDRGGRVAHRLALDAPERSTRVAVLDILPTRTLLRRPISASRPHTGTGSSCCSPAGSPSA